MRGVYIKEEPAERADTWSTARPSRLDRVGKLAENAAVVKPLTPVALLLLIPGAACRPEADSAVLSADVPLHLEEHLATATLHGSDLPASTPAALAFRFDASGSAWQAAKPLPPDWEAVSIDYTEDALRMVLGESTRAPSGGLDAVIYVEVPDLALEDFSHVEIEARTSSPMRTMGLAFNYTREDPRSRDDLPFYSGGDRAPLIPDGSVHTYQLSLDSQRMRPWDGPWTHLAVWATTERGVDSAQLDILSVKILPRESAYAESRTGVELLRQRGASEEDVTPHRRALFLHAPGALDYRVVVPDHGRLDLGLGVLRREPPVTFEVRVDGETLSSDSHDDPERWLQRSVDLSHLAGQTVTLTLSASAEPSGPVALFAAPVLSGSTPGERPNVILYIIDGGGADYMSLYGYPRRTTPNLERLAAQGSVFEHAYSNSSWTRPSTVSFLTSLQHSVLGGLRYERNRVPNETLTLAEHLHRAGYVTAELTSNPNAGRMSNLERGNDFFREAGVQPNSISSVPLHENFWNLRAEYPAEPYFVHFQTTDVHNDHTPVAPFAGLYIDPARRRQADAWLEGVNAIPETPEVRIVEAVDQIGAPQDAYWTSQRDLHDETMAHQDSELGRLVSRLEARGEWERTLLIVAGDHSVAAGSWDYHLLSRVPQPRHVLFDDPATPMLRPGVSRVPLLFVWPGRIQAGTRIDVPVSMIDVMPTILDLLDLPEPEVMQGQSLAPLLLGTPGYTPKPVILDQFVVDPSSDAWSGRIEVIDGRWGASLEVNPDPDAPERYRRDTALQLYDLWRDPQALESLHETEPDLAETYRELLESQLESHRALAERFTPSEGSALTPEQLRALRALGYIP